MAEGGGLLNRYRVKSSIGGSNPPLSAIYFIINNLHDANRQNLANTPAIFQDSRSLWKWRAFSS